MTTLEPLASDLAFRILHESLSHPDATAAIRAALEQVKAEERQALEQLFHDNHTGLPDEGLSCRELAEVFAQRVAENAAAALTLRADRAEKESKQANDVALQMTIRLHDVADERDSARAQLAALEEDKADLDWLGRCAYGPGADMTKVKIPYVIMDSASPYLRDAIRAARTGGTAS